MYMYLNLKNVFMASLDPCIHLWLSLIHRSLLRFKNVLKLLFVLIKKVNVKQCIHTGLCYCVYNIWVVNILKLYLPDITVIISGIH